MFEFNKRDSSSKRDEFAGTVEFEAESGSPSPQTSQARSAPSPSGRREAAIIGPSIHIDGDLRGEEDLLIEGEVKGAVHLKHNGLTIGSQGRVTADVYAHTINVDGYMEGDLYGAERVSIRKSAQVRGNITSPRVSLEDGARFKGSIEMDPDSEALQKAFGDKRPNTGNTATSPTPATPTKPTPVSSSVGSSSTASGKPDSTMAAKGGSAG